MTDEPDSETSVFDNLEITFDHYEDVGAIEADIRDTVVNTILEYADDIYQGNLYERLDAHEQRLFVEISTNLLDKFDGEVGAYKREAIHERPTEECWLCC